MPTFKVYPRTGAVQLPHIEESQCLQIYFVSNMRQQAEKRVQANKHTDIDIIWNIQEMQRKKNNYVKSLKFALEADLFLEFTVKLDSENKPNGKYFRR